MGGCLFQQFKALWRELGGYVRNPGDRARAFLRGRRDRIAEGDDDIDIRRRQLRNQRRQAFEVPRCPAFDQLEIGAGGETALRKVAGDFFRQPAGIRAWREVSWAEETDAVNLGRLRVRGRGNEERGGDEGEKAMHLHSITSSARPSSDIGTVIPNALAVLRLRISSTFVACCTEIGDDGEKAMHLHSITSSARPSSEIGTVIPNALAVLRFRISSTFVACCT